MYLFSLPRAPISLRLALLISFIRVMSLVCIRQWTSTSIIRHADALRQYDGWVGRSHPCENIRKKCATTTRLRRLSRSNTHQQMATTIVLGGSSRLERESRHVPLWRCFLWSASVGRMCPVVWIPFLFTRSPRGVGGITCTVQNAEYVFLHYDRRLVTQTRP